MASVNQTRPHCVNQIGKIHFKPLAAWHGRETAWAIHNIKKILDFGYSAHQIPRLGNLFYRNTIFNCVNVFKTTQQNHLLDSRHASHNTG
jgi:hypothetical protein